MCRTKDIVPAEDVLRPGCGGAPTRPAGDQHEEDFKPRGSERGGSRRPTATAARAPWDCSWP